VLNPVRGLRRLRKRVARRRMLSSARKQGVDVDALLMLARASFVRLQAAWDCGDELTLASIATEPLMNDLREQLRERGPGHNVTEVLKVDAELLTLEELREVYVASVEFSGLIRERSEERASPFRELWLLANPKAPSPAWLGWRLAGVQSLG
jgi:predicted lipid-binding transport protein (Tim44 family)